jgi:pectinesterase
MNIKGSGDALNLRGTVYLTDSRIIGDGDTILGVGPAFFNRCELSSHGAYMWIRNTAANHGNVFVDCTFKTPTTPSPLTRPSAPGIVRAPSTPVLARLPNNHGINYPYAEAVLINCRLQGIPAEGWGPIDDDTSHIHFWEYHSTNLADGQPVDVSKRHPVSRQLSMEKDATTIANYSDPAYVLGGWKPVPSP